MDMVQLAAVGLTGDDQVDMYGWLKIGGRFSVRSAYDLACKEVEEDVPWGGWKLIWKMKATQRVRVSSWLMAHGRLMTNMERWRRRIASDAYCARCQTEPEDVMHALRDCPRAREVWGSLGWNDQQHEFFSLGLRDWVMWALKSSESSEGLMCGAGKLMTVCWWLWRWRNVEVFQGVCLDRIQKLRMLVGSLEEEEQAHKLEGLQFTAQGRGPRV